MSEFLRGAVAACCLLAGLFFLRFWKLTRDRLFLLFSVAFLDLRAELGAARGGRPALGASLRAAPADLLAHRGRRRR